MALVVAVDPVEAMVDMAKIRFLVPVTTAHLVDIMVVAVALQALLVGLAELQVQEQFGLFGVQHDLHTQTFAQT
jgi:hypothetical protein